MKINNNTIGWVLIAMGVFLIADGLQLLLIGSLYTWILTVISFCVGLHCIVSGVIVKNRSDQINYRK